ncbi:MAG: hypothetical protein IKU86_07055 [Thermoguttaceae bacterium]|nr:hypothetical protein [Thermoguttaceae bacterium]
MTEKRASDFRAKKGKFFAFAAPSSEKTSNRGGANESNAASGRRRKKKTRRRIVAWSVFLTSAALAIGAADRGESQCFWRRWARPAPFARSAFYSPTVVGGAPSTFWTAPRPIAVARPVVLAPVVSTSSYPAQNAAPPTFASAETNVCADVCSNVCSTETAAPSVESCSSVCEPCSNATACVETEFKEEEITTYETVWDCETRWRDKTITRQVPETSIKRETVKVQRPVWETVEKETTYNVTRYVPETSTQTRTRTALRPVVQNRERKIVETVEQPVVETVMTQRSYVVNRPTTTYRTETRDYGGYETRIAAVPGRERCCLRWRCGGDYYDPATGSTRYRLPGLYWTPTREPTEWRAQRVYRPNFVSTQVPVTTYVPQTVVENVPTTRTTYRPAQVERTVIEPTTVYVQETRTEQVPVTTYKPVTEQVVKKTPTRVLRMQTVEEERETPVTTYKTVTEIVKEPYVARVARQVPKKTKVLRPIYKTVVPVSTRYLTTPAASETTVERSETVETIRTETTSANGGDGSCCGSSATTETSAETWDAADVAPSLTERSKNDDASQETDWRSDYEIAENDAASSPNLPSAVPNVRRAARPENGSVGNAPPVVSPMKTESVATLETTKVVEETDEGKNQTSTTFETFEATAETTSDAASSLPAPTVAPTRATSERR